jgi:hypothetical protein
MLSGARIHGNLLIPNNDGVDVTSCRNVIISDCDIRTGDDCLAITGYSRHFELPGYRDLRHPCENIVVSNCHLVSRSAAIRIGGFDQNPMRNMMFSNIVITGSNRGIGIFARDEGSIENLTFADMVIETRHHSGDWWGNAEPIHISAVRRTEGVPLGHVRGIVFQNIACRGESGILVYGSKENVIEDVTLERVTMHLEEGTMTPASGGNIDLRPALDPKQQLFARDIPAVLATYVKGLRVNDCTVRWGSVRERFYTHALEVTNFEDITIRDVRGAAAPGTRLAPISLVDGSGVSLRGVTGDVSRRGVREAGAAASPARKK